ncbi:MAG: phytoene/squalene synthase family protein [Acidimicrobiales bacterium]|nr:phytoene/squalene synthase family protein [Acidimicrobiales bacterium]
MTATVERATATGTSPAAPGPSGTGVATLTLAGSYERCRELHRRHGTTYYWATRTLPAVSRPHVHALYGLCRYADEVVDAFDGAPPAARAARLDQLEAALLDGLARGSSDHPVLRAVVFTARAHQLPTDAFRRFFSAMRADLTVTRYDSYEELCGYMDGSAAVIGELMLPILEPFDAHAARDGARDLGIAFQLTNFLRDVGEDLDRGRIYFPRSELTRFGLDPELSDRRVDDAWRAFCRFQIERMQRLYRSADEAIELLPPPSACAIRTARILYSEILERIEANDYDVFSRRARVPLPRKLYVAARQRWPR